MLKHSHLIYDWNTVAGAQFTPHGDAIRFGLAAVKNPSPSWAAG